MTSSYQSLIREKGENATWLARLVTIVEVIYMVGVEVDRLFYQAHAEDACVEVDVLLRIAGEGCNVVDACDQLHDKNGYSLFGRKLAKNYIKILHYGYRRQVIQYEE